jgi:hypothetical protein
MKKISYKGYWWWPCGPWRRGVLGQFSADELRRYLEAWDGRAGTNSQGIALLVEFRAGLVEAVLAPLLAKCREIDPAFSYTWSGVDDCRLVFPQVDVG